MLTSIDVLLLSWKRPSFPVGRNNPVTTKVATLAELVHGSGLVRLESKGEYLVEDGGFMGTLVADGEEYSSL